MKQPNLGDAAYANSKARTDNTAMGSVLQNMRRLMWQRGDTAMLMLTDQDVLNAWEWSNSAYTGNPEDDDFDDVFLDCVSVMTRAYMPKSGE